MSKTSALVGNVVKRLHNLQVLRIKYSDTCLTAWDRGIDGIEFTEADNTAADISYRARLRLPGAVLSTIHFEF